MYATAKFRLMRTAATSLAMASMLAACAPTYAPHLDAPSTPTLETPRATGCTLTELTPPPQLPDVDQSLTACPPGSGFVACFTPAQEAIRQRRFKLLHDDRDYCRGAYDKAVNHASGN